MLGSVSNWRRAAIWSPWFYHYRANTFDSSALYVRNRLWQRPRDLSLDITHLLQDSAWAPHVDPNQIGVAGHSQGGFPALWMGGAKVDPDLFLAFQRAWKNNQVVPAYLCEQMHVDAEPTRDLRDDRVKAAFAMAPGDTPQSHASSDARE
jgi:predicted dienelactone hydrolase